MVDCRTAKYLSIKDPQNIHKFLVTDWLHLHTIPITVAGTARPLTYANLNWNPRKVMLCWEILDDFLLHRNESSENMLFFHNACLWAGWHKFVKPSLGSLGILRTLRNCWKETSLPLFLTQILQRQRERKNIWQTQLKIIFSGSP